jgi:hypothetical protein
MEALEEVFRLTIDVTLIQNLVISKWIVFGGS